MVEPGSMPSTATSKIFKGSEGDESESSMIYAIFYIAKCFTKAKLKYKGVDSSLRMVNYFLKRVH